MAYLQQTYLMNSPSYLETLQIDLEPGKRLLLLDMDETLIHAATLVDIEVNQIYGPNAQPDFYTQFKDEGNIIKIGVFRRPYLDQLI